MNNIIEEIQSCRICFSNQLEEMFSLGVSPLANALLTADQLDKSEIEAPLDLIHCQNCHAIQLKHTVNPTVLFSNYSYSSCFSKSLQEYYDNLARDLKLKYSLQTNDFIVEIASNCGIFLDSLRKNNLTNFIGIDPASNLVAEANNKGLISICSFFNHLNVQLWKGVFDQPKLITAFNVMSHSPDLNDMIQGVKSWLAPDGLFLFEVQYWGDIYQKLNFSNIYHEHFVQWTITALDVFLKSNGFYIYNIERIDMLGGSIRITCGLNKEKENYFKIGVFKELENNIRLFEQNSFKNFYSNLLSLKEETIKLLDETKKKGGKIVGMSYPAKATSILNFFQIGQYFDCFFEDGPMKIGKFTPKYKKAIFDAKMLESSTYNSNDLIFIFANNYAKEIIKKWKDKIHTNWVWLDKTVNVVKT